MNKSRLYLILVSIFVLGNSFILTAQAAPERTVRLSVENMTCVTCPLTVKFSLKQIDGVSFADADYETASAIVSFDPDKTNVEALTKATTNAGYPSKFKEEVKQ